MAKMISEERVIVIRTVCNIFCVSETCYRYRKKVSYEDNFIASCLMHLTNNQKNRVFGLCFLYLCNIKESS